MALMSRLDAISEDVNATTDIDELEDHLDSLSVFLDERLTTEHLILGANPGMADKYDLSHAEKDQITAISADILGKAAEIHAEGDGLHTFFEKHSDLVEAASNEMRRIGALGKMVNALGHNTHFLEETTKSGASAYMLFDQIEDRVGTQTPLSFSGDTSGIMNVMDAHVEGLKEFAETGSAPYYEHATYGIQKFGDMMRSDTIDKLADVGKQHADVIKLRTMAAVLVHFQPKEAESAYSLDHPEFLVTNPDEYPELDKYKEWLTYEDLESYLDQIYVESIRSGADMLRYAHEDDKNEIAKNYIFAIGFIEKAADLGLVRVKSMDNATIGQDIATFKAELPEGVTYPKTTMAVQNTRQLEHNQNGTHAQIDCE